MSKAKNTMVQICVLSQYQKGTKFFYKKYKNIRGGTAGLFSTLKVQLMLAPRFRGRPVVVGTGGGGRRSGTVTVVLV